MSAESRRLLETGTGTAAWKKWGPYLSERQWGTVREDYSDNGDAWNYFSHDQSRSRAYRWGEDGLAGVSDDRQTLCLGLALWNGKDPILKERLFGLTNSEGNHGEDVKEYYFYLDSTPTHSFMRYLYKYPQSAYPYAKLVDVNRSRSRAEFEYELLETGVFDDNRYFDVFVEYAKASPEDLLMQITVCNRGPEAADIEVLPTLWFRNQWSWNPDEPKPSLTRLVAAGGEQAVQAKHPVLGAFVLHCEGTPELLFTENETNTERVFGVPNQTPYVKDAFHRYIVDGVPEAVNPAGTGTKAAARLPRPRSRRGRMHHSPSAEGGRRGSFPGKWQGNDCFRFGLLRDLSATAPRGGRVLQGDYPGQPFGGRAPGLPAGLRRNAVVQAVLSLRRRQVARRAWQRSLQGQPQARAAKRPLAPHVQRRRDFDAG